jgi:hypothetical protein
VSPPSDRRDPMEIADLEWRMERAEAEQVPCPEPNCQAPAGETCRRITDGGLLGRLPAHHRRITAAREAASLNEQEPPQ